MNLLNRAKKLLQGATSAPVNKTQHYHVMCPEGHRLSGTRNEGYQALRCPTCGEGVFVLPRSPFAEIPPPARSAASTSAPRVRASEPDLDEPIGLSDHVPTEAAEETEELAEIEWEEEVAEAQERAAQAEESRRAKAAPVHRPSPAPRPKPRPSRTEPVRDEGTRSPRVPFSLGEWVLRRRNPLIFTAVVLVVVCTLGLVNWRSKLDDYPRQAEIGRTQGLKALEEGRFDTAHQLLSEAKRAVNALGGNVEGADDIRHGADEAALYANLLPESLETLIEQADASESSSWPSRFEKLYKGRAYLFDSYVAAAPGENGATGYDLDYRVFPNGEGRIRRVGRLDLTGFKLFHDERQPKVGARIQFGARLKSFTYDSSRDEWLIGLEPNSGVLLLHHKALETIGWPSEEVTTGEGRP